MRGPAGQWPIPAEAAGCGESASRLRVAVQLLLRGADVPEPAHAGVAAFFGAAGVFGRGGGAGNRDAAGRDAVAGEPAARAARRERADAGAVATVVGHHVCAKRVLEGGESGAVLGSVTAEYRKDVESSRLQSQALFVFFHAHPIGLRAIQVDRAKSARGASSPAASVAGVRVVAAARVRYQLGVELGFGERFRQQELDVE